MDKRFERATQPLSGVVQGGQLCVITDLCVLDVTPGGLVLVEPHRE